ncbi:hypothetical protein BC940DRAFT_334217 [Gongronella butleri]|nr:hypothetical protein BC940DRAFT_334217 [Gongronella butleri]
MRQRNRLYMGNIARSADYGFVEFFDRRDAQDAMEDYDGYKLDHQLLRVRFAKMPGDH